MATCHAIVTAVIRVLFVLALALTACGPKPAAIKQGGGAGQSGGSAAGGSPQTPSGSGPVGKIPDVGCLAPTCAYHAGATGYFTCMAGGAGTCFHFGAPCTPKDNCMYDASDRTYKQCARAVEGMCQQWGAACAPASACMFSASDGLHHKCDDVAGGSCKKYGALCAP